MLKISFAYTLEPLLNFLKTETRRAWTDRYAKGFQTQLLFSGLVMAYDRQVRFGGKGIAILKLLSIEKEPLNRITPSALIREGNLWASPQDFITSFIEGNKSKNLQPDSLIWVIKFELIKRTGYGEELLKRLMEV